MSRIVLFNKPFNVLSQFTDKGSEGSERETLSTYINVPEVYPAGRLDRDSEGLMVLTDDGQLQAQISNPRFKQRKTYLAQIEGIPSEEDLAKLADGIELKDGMTRPAEVSRIEEPSFLWERNPPIRSRKTVQDCWISLTITEGRNRQVRRMTAAIGHPTLRLVRQRVGDWTLDGIKPGEFRLIETKSKPMPKHRPKRPKFLKSHSR
ncbi:MAG: pseudouridine synthase [Paracoccaceae bacterium]|nr:pseudouridine synthase [Paracoccaceae bacterium]MDG2259286.1 pseudouridine synthase [Paracoccaceae bacterium]